MVCFKTFEGNSGCQFVNGYLEARRSFLRVRILIKEKKDKKRHKITQVKA